MTLLIIVYTPGIETVFMTKALPAPLIGITCYPFAMLLLIIEELRKIFLKNF
jgi:hypothetical protein